MTIITPYKQRKVDWSRRVRVYRNLTRGGYSITQDGQVVAHSNQLHLVDVRFIVQEGGRRRTLREGRKYVHAFAEGRLVGIKPRWRHHVEGVRGRYRPFCAPKFEIVEPDGGWWNPIDTARGVTMDDDGMIVYGGA